ncbi:MAG: M14 family zinc carboxypeptidase [Verrucomicrobiae bacterium]|nr:M14 family zinc carboxypeptidase [Verrucomicrobiae bacterium]
MKNVRDIQILTDEDGACPHSEKAVERQEAQTFLVRPGFRRRPGNSEEGPGMGSRLSVNIRNAGSKTIPFTLIADWESPARVLHHDYGYIRHDREAEWRMIPGRRKETRVVYRFDLRPGLTRLGLYPEYSHGQCRRFVDGMKRRRVEVRVAGWSREGRDIWLLRFPSPNPLAADFFIQARDHAYETAGSYCAEGIAGFLLSDDPLNRYLREKFNVWMVPMTNPDGVFNGMSRLTWEQGADMNRVVTVSDASHAVLKEVLDEARPAVFMNIHNWTDKFTDGLLCNETDVAGRIRRLMPDDGEHHKGWRIETLEDWLRANRKRSVPKSSQSWKDYCRERFNATGVCFEFPWFDLNTAAMRKKGARAFAALALAAIGERKL